MLSYGGKMTHTQFFKDICPPDKLFDASRAHVGNIGDYSCHLLCSFCMELLCWDVIQGFEGMQGVCEPAYAHLQML